MPANPLTAPYFTQDTDYPFDQVVVLKTGSYAVNGTSSGQQMVIPHGLPFTPLMGGNWSFTSDFAITYEYSTGTFPGPNPGQVYDTQVFVFADATNIYVSTDKVSAGGTTIYYRVYGFAPAGTTAALNSIASSSDSYLLDSDYNVTKLFMEGTLTLPDTSAALTTTEVDVFHNLGFIPQVQAWIYNFGYVFPAPSQCSTPPATSTLVVVGNIGLGFLVPAGNVAQQAWYRIYADAS